MAGDPILEIITARQLEELRDSGYTVIRTDVLTNLKEKFMALYEGVTKIEKIAKDTKSRVE